MAIATPTVLNPALYNVMLKAFGRVRVANPGSPLQGVYVPDYSRSKPRLSLRIDDFGETYCANCRFCSDTRQRMSVNHRFGVKDPRTGRRHLELVRCFNEDCFAEDYDRRKQLHATLYPEGRYADEVPALPVKPIAPAPVRRATPPPASTSLHELPADHPARAFVSRRGLDPDTLAADFGVGYCDGDDFTSPRLYRPSLVIPVYSFGSPVSPSADGSSDELVGWQARVLDPVGRMPKYLSSTGLPVSKVLYNLPNASRSDGPLVVAEGVSDVWAIGSNAVALFGKTLQSVRASLIAKHARGRPVVVWLDADADTDAQKVANTIRTARAVGGDPSPVRVARCPGARPDPGECTEAEVAAVLEASLSGR